MVRVAHNGVHSPERAKVDGQEYVDPYNGRVNPANGKSLSRKKNGETEMSDEEKVETVSEGEQVVVAEAVEEAPAQEVSSVEADLAAEALEETPVVEEAGTVPVGVVHGLRTKGREQVQTINAQEQLIRKLNTELEDRNKPAAKPTPLETYAAENPETPFGEVPAEVHIADRKFQAEQDLGKATAQADQQRKTLGQASLAKAKADISDYEDIVAMGRTYLSEGDKLDIAMSGNPGLELYKRATRAILNSKTGDATILRKHLQAKKLTGKTEQPLKKPKQKPSEKVQTEEVDEQPMSPRLAQAYAMLGGDR